MCAENELSFVSIVTHKTKDALNQDVLVVDGRKFALVVRSFSVEPVLCSQLLPSVRALLVLCRSDRKGGGCRG